MWCPFSSIVLQQATTDLVSASATHSVSVPVAVDVTSVWEDFDIACKPSAATSVLTIAASPSNDCSNVVADIVGCATDPTKVDGDIEKVEDDEVEDWTEWDMLMSEIQFDEEPLEESNICMDKDTITVANASTLRTATLATSRASTSEDVLDAVDIAALWADMDVASGLSEVEENTNKIIVAVEEAVSKEDDSDDDEVEDMLFEDDVSPPSTS